MIAQQKLLRVFKLIRLLKQRPGRTIPQLAQSLEINKRSVYRYIEFLEEVGYLIDTDLSTKRYYLFEDERFGRPVFTEEESEVMRQAVAGLSPSHPLLGSIRQKLFLASSLVPLADGLVDVHQGQVVQQLAEALRDGRQVQLIRYQSPNSNTIADRLVEPLSFSDDYATLNAYEPASGKVKTFKTRRIDDVAILIISSTYCAGEDVLDLFGWSGPKNFFCSLALTNRAYRLLIEDYPPARAYTGKRIDADFPYSFTGEVRDFRGVGRFILGLPGEVLVEESEELRVYLRARIEEFGIL